MFANISAFLKSITFIDYIFFFSVIFLIILVVSLIYFIKINEEIIDSTEKVEDADNLKEIINNIKATDPKPMTFTPYEKEQEDKAIISYDELLSNTGSYELNYVNEEVKDDLTIKKVDLNNIANQNMQIEVTNKEVPLLSLKREEEFLKALKELQKSLN